MIQYSLFNLDINTYFTCRFGKEKEGEAQQMDIGGEAINCHTTTHSQETQSICIVIV